MHGSRRSVPPAGEESASAGLPVPPVPGNRQQDSGFRASPLAYLDWVLLATLVAVPVAVAYWLGANLTAGLWWDEQWRAYFATLPGLSLDLHQAYSPTSPAWLLIERLAFISLGKTALSLRLPELIGWIALGLTAYLLARRILARGFAYLLSLALILNPATIYYATEMKPYIVEAAVTLGLILVWARAQTARRRWPWYVGMAVLSSLSIPAVFIALPLLVMDAVGMLRSNRGRPSQAARELGQVALAAVLIFGPFAALILPQSGAADYGFFGFPTSVSSFASDLASYFSASWAATPLITSDTGLLVVFPLEPGLLAAVIVPCVVVLACLGIWHLRNSKPGRVVAAVSVVVLVLQCAAALLHKWPLGLIRVNLFVLPLIYFLTVAGISAAYTALRRPGAVRAVSAVVLAAGLAVLGYAGVAQARDVGVLHHAALRYRWEQQLDTVVLDARRLESPGTRFVVLLDGTTTGCLDEPPGVPHGLGWRLYMKLDAGTGHDIPSRDTYFVTTARVSAAHLVRWLTSSDFRHLVEYQPLGGTPGCPVLGGYLTPLIRRAGFHPVGSLAWLHSGKLTRWFRGSTIG